MFHKARSGKIMDKSKTFWNIAFLSRPLFKLWLISILKDYQYISFSDASIVLQSFFYVKETVSWFQKKGAAQSMTMVFMEVRVYTESN